MQKDYSNLNLLKMICAFLVVTIHIPFPGMFGIYVKAIARMAVPVFFIISGFFFEKNQNRIYLIRQIEKVAKLILIFYSLFIIWKFVCLYFEGESLKQYIMNNFRVKDICRLVVYNKSMVSGHFWYLFALLYVLIIVFLLGHFFNKIVYLLPILLIPNLILSAYSLVLFDFEIKYYYTRNFLLTGLPMFAIGYILSQKEVLIKKAISQNISLILFVISCCVNILENGILMTFWQEEGDLYISSVIMAISAFIYFGLSSNSIKISKYIKSNYLTYVYIFHGVISYYIGILIRFFPNNLLLLWCYPIIVFITTYTIIFLIDKRNKNNN